MGVSERQSDTATKLKRISQLSERDQSVRVKTLMHLYNEESLTACFHELDGKKAVGPDGIRKEEYARDLSRNIIDLVERMKRMAYRPGPVRQVLIPKEGKPGATRPLGISDIEDKIVQSMTRKILEGIYEPLFLSCSYGFRPGRGPHDAVGDLQDYLYKGKVATVIDVDLANYFGTIDHRMLEDLLREKIADERFLRYVVRMFKAGVLADGELTISDEGVPQGSICSPILANLFAHHVIDLWLEETVKAHCRDKVAVFRYADDLVICCNSADDARRVMAALDKRLNKFKLRMNAEKTKLIPFSKSAQKAGKQQGTFDYLGFSFHWGTSARGYPIPKVKTSCKRMRSKLKRVSEWARQVRSSRRLRDIWTSFQRKLRGHLSYYAIEHNYHAASKFVTEAVRIVFKWLNRRSQRRSFSWDKFNQFMQQFPLPEIKLKRLAPTTTRT